MKNSGYLCNQMKIVKKNLKNSLKYIFSYTVEPNLIETSQEWSIWGPLPKLLKEIQSMKNSGYHGNQMKIVNNFFKMHLLLNYWTKFDKTLQVWSVWGAPSKLLKIQSIENSGYHGNQ